ncbi:ABC transporter [candidate division WOR_3 bacterium SM23_60]|uniref:ABC transporter n=1 Tax=candidate division WOR_3 bacterium SM23_60 TaxID=1703780 RepID=A0A0S8GI39_UNCW3|nr:MAG: ABC transporter [candidate division WOR_3 bacterium SM23_60]
MHAVQCENLGKTFKKKKGVRALDGVSFSIPMREIFGIVGPNGSGKSTLIRILSTLLIPDHGSAHVFGYDVVREYGKVRPLINRVSVDAAFFKGISAWENLRYAARLYGMGSRDAKQRVLEILPQLGFSESRFYEPLEDLSRGMQQKVAIARAFFTTPMLLLLDEPTTGLDPRSKRDVQRFVRASMARNGLTVVLTTHDMQEAQSLCDRVAIIMNGRFVVVGRPHELLDKYREASLEDVFLKISGHEWQEVEYET